MFIKKINFLKNCIIKKIETVKIVLVQFLDHCISMKLSRSKNTNFIEVLDVWIMRLSKIGTCEVLIAWVALKVGKCYGTSICVCTYMSTESMSLFTGKMVEWLGRIIDLAHILLAIDKWLINVILFVLHEIIIQWYYNV